MELTLWETSIVISKRHLPVQMPKSLLDQCHSYEIK